VTATSRVLVVDAAESFAEDMRAALERRRESVLVDVVSASPGVDRVELASYDAVVAGLRGLDPDDFAALAAVREHRPPIPFIGVTDDHRTARRALARGATDYVERAQLRADAERVAARVLTHASAATAETDDHQFRAYIEHSTDVVTELDSEWTVLYQSPSFERLFGYDREEVVGNTALEYVHPEDRDEVAEAFRQVLDSPAEPFTVSYRFRHADDSWRNVESVGVNRLDDPSVGTIIVNTRDVTERKRRERVLEGLHDAATDIEAADTVEDVCEETVETAEEILDFDLCVVNIEEDGLLPIVAVSESTPPDGANAMSVEEGIVGKTYRTGESMLIERLSEHPEANPQGPYRSAISVPVGEYGVFQTVAHDEGAFDEQDLEFAELLVSHAVEALARVTQEADLRERERELRRQNERLERFASVVSHDLRSPMSVAKGRLELARDECDSDHLEPLSESLRRMQAIVDDVLALAREGNTVDDPAAVPLADVATRAWQTVASESATLEVDDAADTVRADESRLHRLFSNLFVNAVEHAGPTVTVRVESTPDGFFVADDGPGIPEADRESVFEVGYSTAESGTGLGLNIVREIADAHGWSVDVTGGGECGACIEFTGVER
jgi:PAS domain S-box-containing protein